MSTKLSSARFYVLFNFITITRLTVCSKSDGNEAYNDLKTLQLLKVNCFIYIG